MKGRIESPRIASEPQTQRTKEITSDLLVQKNTIQRLDDYVSREETSDFSTVE